MLVQQLVHNDDGFPHMEQGRILQLVHHKEQGWHLLLGMLPLLLLELDKVLQVVRQLVLVLMQLLEQRLELG